MSKSEFLSFCQRLVVLNRGDTLVVFLKYQISKEVVKKQRNNVLRATYSPS